ncbi:MAG: type IV pilin-like G/H family protein [Hormoscilla sp.]
MNDSNQNESSQGAGCVIMALLGIGAIGFWLFVAPYFLNSAGKAKKTEAKMYVGSMNRAQQAYFLDNKEPEEKGKFANEIGKLELGIPTETENYKYLLRATDTATFHYAIPKEKELKGYAGAVFMVETASSGTSAILCKTTGPGQIIPAEPQMENGVPTCGTGTEEY